MGYSIGPKIGIDGEQEFRKQIKEINDTYKALEAETRAVAAAFEAQGDEQGKLEATSKQLQKQIDAQKEKMQLLEDAVKKASDKYGESSIEATRLRGALYDTQATVAGLESELRDTENRLHQADNAMEEFEDSTEDASEATLDFGDVLGANLVSDLILDGLRELAQLTKEVAVESVEEAANMQAAASQFSQTFGNLEKDAKAAMESLSDDVGIASTRMQGRFTTIYAFAKNAGYGAASALTVSSRAMVAAADNAAYYDKSMEDATEQLQSFLKGNYENDAALGISATETTRNTMANKLYAKSFQELSEAQKVDVLLSMVEAGNEASGAIGQAARESDSWANVTAELAEVMRLLQAEAGKPALKKLVPIIQDITAWGYELIEEVDWEEFGDTVEDIAEGVIEHGPGVVRAIAAVTAGIVAMKAAQKVGEFVSLAQSFLSVGTAAKAAGDAVAASGAIANASPWGLAAAAIGAAVTLVVMASTNAKTAAGSLRSAIDDLEKSVKDSDARYVEMAEEINGAAFAAETYVQRLEELERSGLTTAAAHREYELVAKEINRLIPELNLTINEQTGLLDQNTAAVRADIQAWKENATAKALQEKFTDVLEAQGKATAELTTAEAKLKILQDDSVELTQRYEKALEARNAAQAELSKATEEYNKLTAEGNVRSAEHYNRLSEANERMSEARERTKELSSEITELSSALGENHREQNGLKNTIADAEKTLASYDSEVVLAEKSIRLYEKSLENSNDTQAEQQAAIERTEAAIAELEQAYADAKAEALESINSQIGLFEELSMKSDYSAEKIIKNWANQQEAFANYNENLKKAVDMGLDEALVQQLADGSEQSMQILNALVNDTEISIDEINAAFRGISESRDVVAGTLGEIKTDFADSMSELKESAKQSGVEFVNGLIIGVRSRQDDFASATALVGSIGLKGFNREMEIRSPAKKMIPSGEFVVDGAIEGVENRIEGYESAMAELALAGENAFLSGRLNAAAAYPSVAQVPQSFSNSVSHNYGGQTFQIYQQPGESNEDLAYRIMDLMQDRVEVKEAGLQRG